MSVALSGGHHKSVKQANWLVQLYYTNQKVFMITVGGAEFGSGGLYMCAQSDAFAASLAFQVLTGILAAILAFKMFINIYQW